MFDGIKPTSNVVACDGLVPSQPAIATVEVSTYHKRSSPFLVKIIRDFREDFATYFEGKRYGSSERYARAVRRSEREGFPSRDSESADLG